jgi:hypothetical protein
MGRVTEGRHGRGRPLLVALPVFALLALVLMLSASSAFAYTDFMHSGTSCDSCHLDGISQPGTNAACITCHGGKVSPSGFDCWTCHKPGVAPGTDQAACIGVCHTYSGGGQYTGESTPHADPHLGSDLEPCQTCHTITGSSPHHDAQSLAAPGCTTCHDGVIASAQTSHDGVDCTSCHTGMNIPPVPSTCNSCHGAATFGTADCLSCHAGAVHDATPNVGTCISCHPGAQRHADGFGCTTCHKDTVKMHHSTAATAGMAARGGTRTGRVVGLPTTGYPPGGGSPWVLVSGCLTAGVALLFLAWRLRVVSRRHR